MLYKVLYRIVIYLIQLVHKKLVKQQYLNDVSQIGKEFFLSKNRILLATDYLMQLNKEKQHLNNQLEAKRKDTFCLRAVQKFVYSINDSLKNLFLNRTYEDILEMNMSSSKNASATIDDEYKFKVVKIPKNISRISSKQKTFFS